MDLAQQPAEGRSACLARLAEGTARFHEPRRDDCPWCGSTRLRVRLRTADLIQRKPGGFTLERCDDCAHTFQNPRLTAEGLDFYRLGSARHDLGHRDFWRQDLCHGLDGGAPALLARAGSGRTRRLAGVRALSRIDEPESWLDVGTGRARFPGAARDVLPYTAFDGLDTDPGLAQGVRRGRIEEAHHGRLTHQAEEALHAAPIADAETRSVLEALTGIHIDHYVELGFGSVINTVDAFGGVEICPDKAMRDPMAGLNVKAGCQVVASKQALAYVRTRAGGRGGGSGHGPLRPAAGRDPGPARRPGRRRP